MSRIAQGLYRVAVAAARPAAHVLAPLHPKLGRGVAARRGAVERLQAWAERARDPHRPLVWLHAPSVGETLMAQAIAVALRRKRPDLQLAFTWFSPSAERVAGLVQADVVECLPWDVASQARASLEALNPAAVAFVRTEVWPVLAHEAKRRGAAVLLVNAVLPPGSSRVRAPARALLGPVYRTLDAVGAVTREHAERFASFRVEAMRVRVTGDARFDQVWARVHGSASAGVRFLERLRDAQRCTLVAGSTWAPDERVIVDALASLRRHGASWRVVFAPHEPDEKHLEALEKRLAAAGFTHARLAQIEDARATLPDAVIVDRLGILADLYGAGDAAYVGGGFHRGGLHSVVEPAALAVPVLFGPQHANAREAAELAAAGGGAEVSDADTLAERLVAWNNTLLRRGAGDAALHYVRGQLGGAQANAELIAELLP